MIVMSEGETQTEVLHSKIKIGKHNVENYLAAITAVWGNVPMKRFVKWKTLESTASCGVGEVLDGVSYYNDSMEPANQNSKRNFAA